MGDGRRARATIAETLRARPAVLLAVALAVCAAGVALLLATTAGGDEGGRQAATSEETPTSAAPTAPTTAGTAPSTTLGPEAPPTTTAPDTAQAGLLTFRGGPSRSTYGTGPMPTDPGVLWRFPADAPMCAESVVGGESSEWCGTGWTGQPAVFPREGRTWVVFGAFDRKVHFLDAATGERLLPDFPTDDIIKGSVSVDPDGFPLVYTGSRDGFYRVIAIDGDEPVELWKLAATAVEPTLWNDDWDGSGLIRDDFLYIGGENSQFHVVHLNRSYGPDGRVQVAPELVFNAPGWDDELLAGAGDRNVSIEGSVAMHDDVVYFANSGGLVQGWDVAGIAEGLTPERVFRFWMGDDTDATVVIGPDGALYVASEYERGTARSRAVGQVVRLDPSNPDDPLVWSFHDREVAPSGVWATPALHGDAVFVATDGGRLLGLDREDGATRWVKQLSRPTWPSPVVVDDVLLEGDCGGTLHAYDVADTAVEPPEAWSLDLGGCIESTPAVWEGRIFVGTKAGYVYAIGDA